MPDDACIPIMEVSVLGSLVKIDGTFIRCYNVVSLSPPTYIFAVLEPLAAGHYSIEITLSGDPSYPDAAEDWPPVTAIVPLDVAAAPGAYPNYSGLWWNSPAASESGWGINLAHEGDTIFATWFTYDSTGKGWWLSMTAVKNPDGSYGGIVTRSTGPAYDSVPFDPTQVVRTPVGTGTFAFSDLRNGTFAYVVNGIAQTKNITLDTFGTPPNCTFGVETNLALATNYQDVWWAAPAGVESGWGINFAHQGDTIFGTWFTYDHDRTPIWFAVTAPKIGQNLYSGVLYRTTGPAFSSVPFNPGDVVRIPVGTATLAITDGNDATFVYTIAGVTQSKTITRALFQPLGTVCQ